MYMKGHDFSYVYQSGYTTDFRHVFLFESFGSFISGCSRRNIVKQIDVSILWIHKRKQEDHDGPISLTWANRFVYLY